MAYTKRSPEHPYRTFFKTLNSGVFPSVILLCGEERFLIDWAEKSLREKLVMPAAAQLDETILRADETDADEVTAACETFPMLSERKVVVLKDLDFSSSDAAQLAETAGSLPESTLLIITCGRPDKRKALYKRIEKSGLIYDFCPLDETAIAGWVSKRLAAAGKSASQADIVRFAAQAGYFDRDRSYGLYDLENDVKKACLLHDGSTLSFEQLCEASSPEGENSVFALLDAAFSSKKGKAYRLLNNIVSAETPSKQDSAVFRFHALLCSQLEIMLEARQRMEAGQSQAVIQQETGIHSYRLQKAVEASSRLSTARLAAALAGAYNAEKDIKGGRINARLAMELFIAKL